ncbi:MAG: hypothetical protein HC923_03225 [Myxococcales bacterium]|nr:hypothetical protein [Myxococcales bacterium]
MTAPAEHHESLWWLVASPALFLLHFLVSYATVAIDCAKRDGSSEVLGISGLLVTLYTAVALVGMGFTGSRATRRHEAGRASVPHDFDTPEDRTRFLGFATFLLSGLSIVAVLYVAASVALVGTCA